MLRARHWHPQLISAVLFGPASFTLPIAHAAADCYSDSPSRQRRSRSGGSIFELNNSSFFFFSRSGRCWGAAVILGLGAPRVFFLGARGAYRPRAFPLA